MSQIRINESVDVEQNERGSFDVIHNIYEVEGTHISSNIVVENCSINEAEAEAEVYELSVLDRSGDADETAFDDYCGVSNDVE